MYSFESRKSKKKKNTNITYLNEKAYEWTSTSAKTLGIIFHTDRDQILELNLQPKIIEFKKCLETWKKRNLTPLGKITVIKSFAIPKLIYPLTTLHNPPQDTILDIKKSLNEFLWNSRINKISHKTVIQDYEDGGLKMIDIESFIYAIKASWVKRLIDENNKGYWKLKYAEILKKIGGNFVFSCNCNYKDVHKMIKNKFLQNVLEAWCRLNYNETSPILHQIIWNNSNIKNNGVPLFFQQWYDKGIIYLHQLVENHNFMNFNKIRQTFDISNRYFLEYHKLISCIPHSWKNQIKYGHDDTAQDTQLINKLKSVQKPTQMFYRMFINKLQQKVKAHIKWENYFVNEHINWKTIHAIPFKSTIDTKLRYFQYKCLMRIIPTNKFLLKCQKVASNLCDFCNCHVETQIHLFYDCYHVQDFWGKFKLFLTEKGFTFDITKTVVFLGMCDDKYQMLNFLIICAKYFIYCCKLKATRPTIDNFVNVIKVREKIEKIIALNHNNYDKHERKWALLCGQ